MYTCSVISVCVYLFDGEVVDQVVVVFVEAAVQRDTVGVEEQVLKRNIEKGPFMMKNETKYKFSTKSPFRSSVNQICFSFLLINNLYKYISL